MRYSDSQKLFPHGIALLGKPAVAPTNQSVITFENCYNYREPTLVSLLAPMAQAMTSTGVFGEGSGEGVFAK
ncbi:MAG: hypothetical protein AB1646_26675, partial [Thermodesulfobacteriota bacterium]